MRKKLSQTFVGIVLVSLLIAIFFQFQVLPVNAAGSLTNVSNTMERLKKNTPANQTIEFTVESDVPNGGYIEIVYSTAWQDFPEMGGGGFLWFLKYAGLVPEAAYAYPGVFSGDADVEVYNETTAHTYTDGLECNIGTEEMDVHIFSELTRKVILLEFCPGDGGSLAAGDTIKIYAGAFTTETEEDGTNKIVNPLAAGIYSLNLRTTNSVLTTIDSGSLSVYIVDSDQVTVTASIDATFTFALSSNTCALGTLTTANVKTCTYTSTVTTNATSGYTATIRAESDGANINLNNDANPAIWINNVADFNVTAGFEEYGFAIGAFGFGLPPSFNSDEAGCNEDSEEPAQALTASPIIYAGWGNPTTGHSETLCHIAAITATSEAGTYTQVVTLIATGKF